MDRPAGVDAAVEAAVRQYLAKIARRYAPFAIGAVTLLVVVTLVPSVNSRTSRDRDVFAAGGGTGGGTAAGDGTTITAPPGSAGAAGGGAVAAASGPAGGTGGAGSTGGAAGRTSGGTVGATSGVAPGSPGVARTGVACGPGVRQMPWSKYAPLCVPKFEGNNGGATSHGVSADTITVTYRISNSGESAAVAAAAGPSNTSDQQYIADLNTYIDLFNKSFELYGRKVVLKPFTGQGDWIQEEQGQDLAAAQADATTAHDMGAFADLSLTSVTQPYSQDLAQMKVISLGAVFMPQSWFEDYAPYTYSIWPTGTKWAQFNSTLVCQRMAGMPAVYSGDAAMQNTQRKFGILVGDAPTYQQDADELQKFTKGQCGAGYDKRVAYSINVATYQQQATSIVAQFKSAGVTTIVCGCDSLMLASLAHASAQQQYTPEWSTVYWGDPAGRLPAQSQFSHALTMGGQALAKNQAEAYKAYKLANANGEPADQYFPFPYEALLQLFAGLQAAGPNLNPRTFQQGVFSLPPSLPGGDYGDWAYGANAYTPEVGSRLGWWNPNGTSNYDGQTGAWENCSGGKWFRFDRPEDWGPAHTQLACFGK